MPVRNNRIMQYAGNLVDNVNKNLEKVLDAGMVVAKQNVGVDTGALRASIHKGKKNLIAGTGLPDDRAIINNYGTVFQAGTGYMDKAAQEMYQVAQMIKLSDE